MLLVADFLLCFFLFVLHQLIPTSIPLTRFHKQINIDPLRGHHNLLIPLLFFYAATVVSILRSIKYVIHTTYINITQSSVLFVVVCTFFCCCCCIVLLSRECCCIYLIESSICSFIRFVVILIKGTP